MTPVIKRPLPVSRRNRGIENVSRDDLDRAHLQADVVGCGWLPSETDYSG